jgi:uncharacterized membrane protein YphA (DoxX/SURF4 family)
MEGKPAIPRTIPAFDVSTTHQQVSDRVGAKTVSIDAIVLESLLALLFCAAGGGKIAGLECHVENFRHFGYPQAFRPVVGAIENTGALGLVIGIVVHWVAPLAALWLARDMIGAFVTHTRIRDFPQELCAGGGAAVRRDDGGRSPLV